MGRSRGCQFLWCRPGPAVEDGVRASPGPPPAAPTDLGGRAGPRRLRRSELLDLPATATRVLVRPSEPWRTLADAVLRPLLGGGSAVVVAGEVTEAELERIAAAERVSEALP